VIGSRKSADRLFDCRIDRPDIRRFLDFHTTLWVAAARFGAPFD
jgi:hypothetical protein